MNKKKQKRINWNEIGSQKALMLMSFPFLVWMIAFCYAPLAGWFMAFFNYRPGKSWSRQVFVGFDNFKEFLTDQRFFEVLRNTVAMGGAYVIVGTFMAIFLAIMLNEVKYLPFKKVVQTVSYLPHFIAWTIVASISYTLLSTNGVINGMLIAVGFLQEPVPFMAKKELFWPIMVFFQNWKEMGWSAIIYLSAITAIDASLYEAAEVDGITWFGKIIYITLPSISGTIALLLVLSIGGLFNATGFDASYLLGNPMVVSHSDNLAVYAYRYGLEMSRFSMSTAISIFNSIVSLIFLFTANFVVSKLFGRKII